MDKKGMSMIQLIEHRTYIAICLAADKIIMVENVTAEQFNDWITKTLATIRDLFPIDIYRIDFKGTMQYVFSYCCVSKKQFVRHWKSCETIVHKYETEYKNIYCTAWYRFVVALREQIKVKESSFVINLPDPSPREKILSEPEFFSEAYPIIKSVTMQTTRLSLESLGIPTKNYDTEHKAAVIFFGPLRWTEYYRYPFSRVRCESSYIQSVPAAPGIFFKFESWGTYTSEMEGKPEEYPEILFEPHEGFKSLAEFGNFWCCLSWDKIAFTQKIYEKLNGAQGLLWLDKFIVGVFDKKINRFVLFLHSDSNLSMQGIESSLVHRFKALEWLYYHNNRCYYLNRTSGPEPISIPRWLFAENDVKKTGTLFYDCEYHQALRTWARYENAADCRTALEKEQWLVGEQILSGTIVEPIEIEIQNEKIKLQL